MARAPRARRRAPQGGEPANLRVIGGTWRSRRLSIADRPGLRPTPNRIRETLFNWLAPRIEGAVCCDLFAGTGALGIEALSRGAARVCFFETDERAAAGIEQALATLAATDRAHVLRRDGCRAGAELAAGSVDLVFVDPPFDADLHGPALAGLAPALHPGARLYLEYPADRAETVTQRLTADYEILRASRAAGVAFCLITPRRDVAPARTES